MKEKIHFDTPDAKDFVATFRQLTNRHESWKVWSDFVTLSACSIAVQFDCADRDRVEQRLKWVSNVSDRYSDDELERFGKLLEITASALQADPNQDFLGRLYMSLDFGNSWRGQFFTPWNVAYMMAMMTMGQDDDLIAKRAMRVHWTPVAVPDVCSWPLLRPTMPHIRIAVAGRICCSLVRIWIR